MSKPVETLLNEFASRTGCRRYTKAAAKLELLCDYLWTRQFAPSLSFDAFLDRYAAVADYDGENCKHPTHAVERYCPTRAVDAAARGLPQWSQNERIGILALYIEALRLADAENRPLDVPLANFLADIGPDYKAGKFSAAASAPVASEPPVATSLSDGARVIYEKAPGGRQYRGRLLRTYEENGSSYADFQSDAGEIFRGVALARLSACADPPPVLPEASDRVCYQVPPDTAAAMCRRLYQASSAESEDISVSIPMRGAEAHISVCRSSSGPYVDAYLVCNDQTQTTIDLPPRNHIEGDYWFVLPDGTAKHLTITLPFHPADWDAPFDTDDDRADAP